MNLTMNDLPTFSSLLKEIYQTQPDGSYFGVNRYGVCAWCHAAQGLLDLPPGNLPAENNGPFGSYYNPKVCEECYRGSAL